MPMNVLQRARIGLMLATFTVTSCVAWTPSLAAGGEPMVSIAAPGFFRFMLGDFEITALSDGTSNLPVEKLLQDISPAKVEQALAEAFLKTPVETSFNGFLINTGSKLVLVDAGAGRFFGPTLGKLLGNLQASGYRPEQIDEVYLTHMHSDHVGGVLADEKAAFPNATVRASKDESDFWLSAANLEQAPEDSKGSYRNAVAALAPYVKAKKYRAFDGPAELVPGVKSYESRGHTPGHAEYIVESKGQKLVLIGDLIHVGAVQFGQPSVTISFDRDSKTAMAERKKAFDAAAKQGYLIAGAHLPFPGVGHLRIKADGYEWVPMNFTQMNPQ